MKTPATKQFPEIDWDVDSKDILESDIDERMKIFGARGWGLDGKDYFGSAVYFCEEFYEMRDIEKI